MAIVTVFELPGMTQDMYEQIANKLTDGRGMLKDVSDWPVEGLLSHTCQSETSFSMPRPFWETEAAFQQFGKVIVPLHQEVGAPVPEPKVHQVYNVVTA